MAQIYRHRFGPLVADQGDFDNAVSTAVDNLVPSGAGFSPTHELESQLAGVGQVFQDTASLGRFDDEYFYTAEGNIYEIRDSSGTFAGTARSSGLSLDEPNTQWVRFGENMICTDYNEPVQIQTSRGTNFADCFTGPFRPEFKYCATLGERVVFANGKSLTAVGVSSLTDVSFLSGYQPHNGTNGEGQCHVANTGNVLDSGTNTEQFAIETHIHVKSLPDSNDVRPIWSRGNAGSIDANGTIATGSNPGWAIYIRNAGGTVRFVFLTSDGSTDTTRVSTTAVVAGRSYALGYIYVGGVAYVYVDGVREGQDSISNHTNNAVTGGLLSGLMTDLGRTRISGDVVIGETRYWLNKGLTGGLSGTLSETAWTNYDQTDPIPAEPSVWLKFDELSGTGVRDIQSLSQAALYGWSDANPPVNGSSGAWASIIHSEASDLSRFSSGTTVAITGSSDNESNVFTLTDDGTSDGYLYVEEPTSIENAGTSTSIAIDVAGPPSATDPNIVWWSGTNNARIVGSELTDPALRTGWQLLYDDHGDITGLSGGRQFLLVFKETAIYRMNSGGPFGFEFAKIGSNIGTQHPNSIVRVGDDTFFWGPRGPSVANFNGAQALAVNKVSRLMLDKEFLRVDRSADASAQIRSFYSSASNSVVWFYKRSTKTTLNQGIVYHLDRNEFTSIYLTPNAENEDGEISTSYDVKGVVGRSSHRGKGSETWRPLGDMVLLLKETVASPPSQTVALYTFHETTQSGTATLSNDDVRNPKISTGYLELNPGRSVQVVSVRPMLSMSRSADVNPDVEVTITSRKEPFDLDSDDVVTQVTLSGDSTDGMGWIPCQDVPDYPFHRFDVRLYQGASNSGKIVELVGLDIEYTMGGRR